MGCDLKELLFQLGTASTRVPAWAESGILGNNRHAGVTGVIRKTRNRTVRISRY